MESDVEGCEVTSAFMVSFEKHQWSKWNFLLFPEEMEIQMSQQRFLGGSHIVDVAGKFGGIDC